MQLIDRLSRRLRLRFKREVEEIVSQDRPGVSARFIPLPRRDNVSFVSPSAPNNHLPVPPRHLWEGYAETEAEYLKCGQDDVAQMLGILNEVEQRPVALERVLDLGCASGRMLRFVPREETSEHWGLDINAAHIEWCQQNLNPPMLFATNTTAPHLPFEDNQFDLLYCGSVFTHISELAEAWLLEVRRVLRPSGYAYITIHTRQTIDLLRTKYRDNPLFADFLAEIDSALVSHEPEGREWSIFTVGTDPFSQVFYDVPSLERRWGRVMPVLAVVEKAHDHQAAVVMRKRAATRIGAN
ncbi:class I SAM-dependent methyltransferase [Bradyrhizobium sp. JYMT SZCCT0428]|uniref:class I SAM-dependent methyltransferase n=1 Tax=Bradyrhizobium sp. JYMT SZCCT0428 TaxID=2807673 RepID=UPI001BAD38B4|nr:class I SAM-dependent methyltransferase [Bradyrhizobium sp. JYMT SZCCT0428]MBR1157441.1 class I SAM-dependent methyltransferase [Bradyrhizobium sp. JYMT SZCCT0428]